MNTTKKTKSNDCVGEFGIVKIIKGKYKGRFAYYDDIDYDDFDDDDIDEDYGVEDLSQAKAVIYLGDIVYNSPCIYLDHDYITTNFTFKDLQDRLNEIVRLLFDDISDKERMLLVEEKSLINSEIITRYENFITTKKVSGTKVFLSHSSKDKSMVIPVALDLEKKEISPWLDAFDILPGESIVSKINEGLAECDFVILFLSKNSVTSNWVKKEWETILWDEIDQDKTKIIPVKLDDCEVPKILQTKKYIDFSNDYNYGLSMVIDTIKRYNDRDK